MKREIEMLNIPPVKTRLPLSAWAVAAVIALFALLSSVLHLSPAGRASDAGKELQSSHRLGGDRPLIPASAS